MAGKMTGNGGDADMAYKIEFDEAEKTTADWLDDHGYFGDFFKHARLVSSPEDGTLYQYEVDETGAWLINEYVQDDYHAFLACNGSHSLAEKMRVFLDSIV